MSDALVTIELIGSRLQPLVGDGDGSPGGKTASTLGCRALAELVAVDAKIKKSTAELKAMVLARGSSLMDLPSVGPVVAARVLADVGDVASRRQQVRVLDRHRTLGRLLRGERPAPPVPGS